MTSFKSISLNLLPFSLISSVVFAQNLPLDKDVFVASYNWTGVYAGLSAGAIKNTMSVTDTNATYFNATILQIMNPAAIGGIQVGYRRQWDPSVTSGLLGVEFAGNFSDAKFQTIYGTSYTNYQLSSESKLHGSALVQLIGGIASNNTLLFLAGGLSWVNITGSFVNLDEIPFSNVFNTGKKTIGTALGAGIEYAFNNKLSARLKVDVMTSSSYTRLDNVGNRYEIANTVAQGLIGINYKLG